jgi:hypothetical protein
MGGDATNSDSAVAAEAGQSGASPKEWSQVSFWEGLQTVQTELNKIGWAVDSVSRQCLEQVANPQEVMAQTVDFVTREQPKVWLREFERCSARLNAGCGAPDPAAAAAEEFVVGARCMRPTRVPYLVVNSFLQSDEKVLSYCFTKSLWDKVPAEFGAAWGTTVRGIDEGDGWLRVGHRYLPMEVAGAPVLARVDELDEDDGEEVQQPVAVTQDRGPPHLSSAAHEEEGVPGSKSESTGTRVSEKMTAPAGGRLPDLIDVGLPDLIDLADCKAPEVGSSLDPCEGGSPSRS